MTTYRLEQDFRSMRVEEDGRPVASQQQTVSVSNTPPIGYTATAHTSVPAYDSRGYSGNPPHASEIEVSKPKPTFIRAVDPAYASNKVNLGPRPYKPPEQYRTSGQVPEPYRSTSGDTYQPPVQSQAVHRPSGDHSSRAYQPTVQLSQTYRPTVEPYRSTGQSPEPAVYSPGSSSDSGGAYPYRPTPAAPQNYRPPSSGQKSPSPMQERHDFDTNIPQYMPSDRVPQGVSSRIMTTTPVAPVSTGYAQSRHTSSSPPLPPPPPPISASTALPYRPLGQPHSPVSVAVAPRPYAANPLLAGGPVSGTGGRLSDPRPYQLKPTLDAHSGERLSAQQPQSQTGKQPGKQPEAELDALTNLLVQNMEASADPDFFGMCAKCGQPIKGDSQGCTALDQMFHVECFTCVTCGVGLKGRPFFAMEGKPYCEACYMNTLEKCSVCSKPITDRILRATGKPYHPSCFKCVVCGRNLDGVPFTVDAASQIHCIEDFHKKFAPRCCVCGQPIIPEPGQEETVRVVAMDRSFHVNCYTCEDCGVVLSSEAEGRGCYPLDEHILCKACNAHRIQKLTTKMTTDL